MPKAYSLDLRQKVLMAWKNQEGSQRQLAKRFKVSLTFITTLLRQYRQTSDIRPKKQGGDRRSKIKGEHQQLLEKLVKENNDLYLWEIQSEMFQRTGIEVGTSSLCRKLQQMKLNRKKKFNCHRARITKSKKSSIPLSSLARSS